MKNNKQTTNILSITAVCFFAPLIQNLYKNHSFGLNEEEHHFVMSYIHYGYVTLSLLLTLIVSYIAQSIYPLSFRSIITTIVTSLTIIALLTGFILIATGTSLHHSEKNTQTPSFEMIPFYNYYLRYKTKREKKSELLEESLLRTQDRVILTIIDPSKTLSLVLIIAYIIRLVSLSLDQDIFKKIKKYRKNIFTKHPEEVLACVTTPLLYLGQIQEIKETTYQEKVERLKKSYQQENNFRSNKQIISYAILFVLAAYMFVKQRNNINQNTWAILTTIARGAIIMRIMLASQLKNGPQIPLLHEARLIFSSYFPTKKNDEQ